MFNKCMFLLTIKEVCVILTHLCILSPREIMLLYEVRKMEISNKTEIDIKDS